MRGSDTLNNLDTSSPKISKGENYLQLPYVLLDYPRCFYAGNFFAVRTMFWWGNFFSITLQLKGIYREMSSSLILRHYSFLSGLDYSLAISPDEWRHDFGEDNYRKIKDMDEHDFRLYVAAHPYIKIARIFPLSSWDTMREQFGKAFGELGLLIAQPVK